MISPFFTYIYLDILKDYFLIFLDIFVSIMITIKQLLLVRKGTQYM